MSLSLRLKDRPVRVLHTPHAPPRMTSKMLSRHSTRLRGRHLPLTVDTYQLPAENPAPRFRRKRLGRRVCFFGGRLKVRQSPRWCSRLRPFASRFKRCEEIGLNVVQIDCVHDCVHLPNRFKPDRFKRCPNRFKRCEDMDDSDAGIFPSGGVGVQVYLTHKKHPPPRTLQ